MFEALGLTLGEVREALGLEVLRAFRNCSKPGVSAMPEESRVRIETDAHGWRQAGVFIPVQTLDFKVASLNLFSCGDDSI